MSTTPPEQPSEEELRAALEEQLRHITANDIVVQTVVSLINLAGRRLGLTPDSEQERDLAQVRTAIDATRALMPIVERGEGAETVTPVRNALASLQMEYAKLAQSPPAAEGGGDAQPQPTPGEREQQGEQQEPTSQPGPAQASGRLWVPGSAGR